MLDKTSPIKLPIARWLPGPMPHTVRDYLHLALLAATAILSIAGAVVFLLAVSFQGYIGALMLFALAGCSFTGARELGSRGAKLPRSDNGQKGPIHGSNDPAGAAGDRERRTDSGPGSVERRP